MPGAAGSRLCGYTRTRHAEIGDFLSLCLLKIFRFQIYIRLTFNLLDPETGFQAVRRLLCRR